MRLRSLETYGFKSFADRMVFDFEKGITAVIGPNGCGKSNIVDSIKWVVGEQSAKALRGSEMADVIFNGCATRRPMAMAEVTLTLDDVGSDKGLGATVALTRRLTRDGVSSYFLNGRPCRLKDIRELLMDTGVGTSAYSTIEQGRIGFILEASTKDRRAILEEAAGISRYKARRKLAGRKLERVQLDLERIGQLFNEVERRARSVRKQAETALRFQELTRALKELRLVFALEEFGRLRGELGGLEERCAALETRGLALAARVAESEAAIAEDDAKLLGMEDILRQQERSRGDAQSRRDVADSRTRDAKHRITEVDLQAADDQRALAEHGVRAATIAEEQQRTREALDQAGEAGDERLAGLYQSRKAELDRLLSDIDGLIRSVEERKGRQVECLRELARIEAEQSRIRSTTSALGERRGRLEERARSHAEANESTRHTEEQARSLAAERHATVQAAHARLDELIRAREAAQTEGQHLDTVLNDLRHEEGRSDVRLRMLSEYERKQEGVFRGVQDIIRSMDRFPGVIGLVADCFRVGKREELAIETALGGAAQNIITETQHAAKEAIDFLKRERRGRATFLPLDDIRGRERPEREFLRAEGVVGVGVDLIEFESRFRPAFEHLLGGLLVVETMDHAIALRRRGARCLLVTLDGEVINPGGAMTGGRQQGAEAGGLVSRKNELRRLEEQLAELSTKRQEAATARDATKKRAFELSLQVEEQRKAIQARERELSESNAALAKAERDRVHQEEFAASFGSELEEIALELARVETDGRDVAGQAEWFTALRVRLDADVLSWQEKLRTRGSERDRVQEEINTLRVEVATSEERRESLRNHLGHLERMIQELDDQRRERERRLASHAERRAELLRTAAEQEALRTEAHAQFEELAAAAAATLKERDTLRNSVEERRQGTRQLAAEQRACERDLADLRMKEGELRVRVNGLSERIAEDYQVDLAQAFSSWERPADLDLPKVRRDLLETERAIAALGPVNLAAIDELKEAEARRDFLARQHEDLQNAATKLGEIIEQINTTSRKLFLDTYKSVRRNFQELFRKLYGGGKADLILEEDESGDVLEAGVEIIAQPPGKQPKSITLLSGGEKALTAIALLFGVYQIKPSPFCLLDEVDAPLDESNTDVYCRMIREFCAYSQFIVITHNKRTMQYADAIYGITQAERGISTKISVKLEQVGHDGELLPSGRGPFAEKS